MLSELAICHIRCCLSAIPSDLMKSTVVDESLSSMNQQFCSRENQLLQLLQENEKSTSTCMLVFEIHDNVDLVLGIKNIIELEGVFNSQECCFSFLNRSLSIFPKDKAILKPGEQKIVKVEAPFTVEKSS